MPKNIKWFPDVEERNTDLLRHTETLHHVQIHLGHTQRPTSTQNTTAEHTGSSLSTITEQQKHEQTMFHLFDVPRLFSNLTLNRGESERQRGDV